MDRQAYRAAVDSAPFSPDFQERTLARLEALAQEKEPTIMKRPIRTLLTAACLAAALAVSAFAAVTLLSPKQVADHLGNSALAAAFAGKDAITLNQTCTVDGYAVTLMGLVSGGGIDLLDLDQEQTYAVLSYQRADGSPIGEDLPPLTATPLVEGYAPWEVNAWTLGGGVSTFLEDGVYYSLFQCDTLEPFADHTVYLAVYAGLYNVPGAEDFSFGADGSIALQPGLEGTLFPLPLDSAKADPARAADLLAAMWDDDAPGGNPEAGSVQDSEAPAQSFVIRDMPDGSHTVLRTN